jgi:Lon-like ATP-dependent protease
LIPESNVGDINLDSKHVDEIEIVPVKNINEVLDHALVGRKKKKLLEKLKQLALQTFPVGSPIPQG